VTSKVDVQPVGVDRLMTFEDVDLGVREKRIRTLIGEYTTDVTALETALGKAREVLQFLTVELEEVVLALKLKKGDMVRTVCQACAGSGLRAADVTSGKFLMNTQGRSGSAFEGTGGGSALAVPQLDPALRCTVCKGKKYQTLERFKG